MNWTLPGTTLTEPRASADQTPAVFHSMFLAGGMVLSQVASITGLEPYTIQNWVKRGFLAPPRNKRYDMEQVCRIITINMLKGSLSLEKICTAFGITLSLQLQANDLDLDTGGDLADDSDDIIDDAVLYFMFVKLAARAKHIGGSENWEIALDEATASYAEPYPGARERVQQVLRTMLMAYIASRFQAQVNTMVDSLT